MCVCVCACTCIYIHYQLFPNLIPAASPFFSCVVGPGGSCQTEEKPWVLCSFSLLLDVASIASDSHLCLRLKLMPIAEWRDRKNLIS